MKQNSGQKAIKWTAMQSLEVHVKETNQFIVIHLNQDNNCI